MVKEKGSEAPLEHGLVAKRGSRVTDGEAHGAAIRVLDAPMALVKATRISHDGDRLRITAEVGAEGLSSRVRRPRIPATGIRARDAMRAGYEDLKGYCPPGVRMSSTPGRAKPTHQLRPSRGKGRDPGGTIFDDDDRYLFDDVSFPWRTTGKIKTAGKWGSGTTIGPRHVLTASHVIDWDGDDGTISPVTFTPGYFDGDGPWGDIAATRVIYWEQAPGSLTDQQTAFDYVVLIMEERIGDTVGYAGFRTYSDDWNDGKYWQFVGYPGERSSGERPAYQGACVVASVGEEELDGQDGYVMGHFNDFTPGQSGGALWGWWGDEPWPRVVGVGSTIGSTDKKKPTGSTTGDNEYGGGPALSNLIAWARNNYP